VSTPGVAVGEGVRVHAVVVRAGVGFLHVEDATEVLLVQGGTLNANMVYVTPYNDLWTPADASTTKRSLGLRIEGNEKLYWYLDGVEVGSIGVGQDDAAGTTAVAFDGQMGSTIAICNNDTSVNRATATVDYIAGQVTRYDP